MNVSAVIKSIRNIMRQDKGVNGDAQRLEQMGWMLFLKIFDAKDEELEDMEETGEYVSPIPKEYQWRNWAANDEGITGDELITFIDRKLFPDLSNLKVQDNKRAVLVRDVFRGNNNYMKSGQLFRQVVNELNKIDFHASKDRHIFGQVYETILKELQSAGSSGEFYTPRAVTEFMTQIIDPKLGERILDPACGTGGFLTATIEHIRKSGVENLEQRQQLQNSVHGFELKPLPHMLAVTNLILHDIEVPDISYEDSLLRNQSIKPKNRVDVILANPPFGGNVDDATAATFPVGFRTKESADLFLVMMVNYLKQGGRAAIVLPDASLTGDGIKSRVREMLLRNCCLHTIVRLPNSVFRPYATVGTNLLFFERISSPAEELDTFATKEIWYYEHQLPEGSKGYSMTNPIKLEEFEVEKAWWNNRTESEKAWKINLKEIIEKAIDNAKPHYEKEREFKREIYSLKEKISVEKTVLKDIDKNQPDKIEKQQEKIKQLEFSLQETETNARIEKQTADSIYYASFDLDIKNPNRIEEDLGDPSKLIEKQNSVNLEISKILGDIEHDIHSAIVNSHYEILLADFKRFIKTKSNVKQLRQIILQLAIKGKLSSKWRDLNPDVEPASFLFEKIKSEKEQLIKEGKIRREKILPEVKENEIFFELPAKWKWLRLGEILKISSGDGLTSNQMDGSGNIPVYGGNGINGYHTEFNVQKTTIVIGRVGAYCGSIHITDEKAWVTDNAFITYYSSLIHQDWFYYLLMGLNLRNCARESAQPVISGERVYPVVFGLPPHEEQKQIVFLVKSLLSLCDELEKKIEKRDSYQERIMQALVKEVLGPKGY